jgi:hypothetical protein
MTALTTHVALRPVLVVALVVAACGSQVMSPAPAAQVPVAPDDWVVVSTAGAELQMTLPPWLGVFDNSGAIFASEAPPPGTTEIPIQLMAVPPGMDAAPEAGGDLLAWLDTRLEDPGKGVPVVTEVNLPAGPAIRYARLDRAGTPTEWQILAFAIRTPSGVAYLMIDGLPSAWPAHADEIERIPFLVRVR